MVYPSLCAGRTSVGRGRHIVETDAPNRGVADCVVDDLGKAQNADLQGSGRCFGRTVDHRSGTAVDAGRAEGGGSVTSDVASGKGAASPEEGNGAGRGKGWK